VGESRTACSGMPKRSWALKAGLLAVAVITAASMAIYFGGSGSAQSESTSARLHSVGSVSARSASASPASAELSSMASLVTPAANRPGSHPVSASSLSFPLFFEPNVGQTDSRVKFLARGSGYGLFLTADEAVLSLQHHSVKGRPSTSNVVRMHLDGSSTVRVQGAEQLPGKSNYFIGNDPSKWRRGISQFAQVEYQRVYPGIDLVYYGNQQQLEYDFHVAPDADPNQIALSFEGASTHLDSGDLVLSTSDGDIRFHAPHIYQRPGRSHERASAGGDSDAVSTIDGGFRLLAGNKVGFVVGSYDRSRELVIDPLLSYSTYLGMGGESAVSEAIDFANNIYVAGSTTSATFPTTSGAIQTTLGGAGAQNIFIAVLDPLAGSAQLLYATYLGGSGLDTLGGVAVDPGNSSFPNIDIYVAGTTTSTNFPTTSANAFQPTATFTGTQTHGFLSAINASNVSGSDVFTLSYSTYLAGNTSSGSTTENDVITGLAVDSFFDAYVTGTTTSTDILTGFPSTANGYQICPWQPAASGGTACPITSGPTQFFASQVNTHGSGLQSMLYSTYFGGGYPLNAIATGGGISVDVIANNPHSNVNMYFTGTTNMWGGGAPIPNGAAPFPLVNAWQSCLNQSGITSCQGVTPSAATDAFVVKLNPNQVGAIPTYSTYLGGSGDDHGIAVAADTIGNSYVTGSTDSGDWSCTNACVFAPAPYNALYTAGATNAYIAKVTDEEGGLFPLVFFAYIGGSGPDSGNAIAIDAVQSAHIVGTTSSPATSFPILNASQTNYGGPPSDAFAALLTTTTFTSTSGDYVTYVGGNALDQGTGIALDTVGNTYVAGVTKSSNFPVANPYQPGLIGAQDAFLTKLGSNSVLVVGSAAGSPTPSVFPAGLQGTFTFTITNNGPDPASNVSFDAGVPQSGVQTIPTAEVISGGTGSCTNGLNGTIICNVGTLAVGAQAEVAVFVTPSIPKVTNSIGVTGQAFANNGQASNQWGQSVEITDFSVSATLVTPEVTAGELAQIDVTVTPDQTLGYNASVTLTQSTSPSMVTSPAPTFSINPVVLSATSAQTTVLNIQTVPRPINSGSLLRHRTFYAAWLPIGGLSLVGLGIGAGRKRRRWLIGMLLGLLAGLILLQPACGSGSSAAQSGGGTAAQLYFITITASAGTGAAHNTIVSLQVN
jgi:Domain of unknown function DUF11/Beta-propeller repeat